MNKQLISLKNENGQDDSYQENILKSNTNTIDNDGNNDVVQEKFKVLADVRELKDQNKMISEENLKNKKILEEKKDELKKYKEKK